MGGFLERGRTTDRSSARFVARLEQFTVTSNRFTCPRVAPTHAGRLSRHCHGARLPGLMTRRDGRREETSQPPKPAGNHCQKRRPPGTAPRTRRSAWGRLVREADGASPHRWPFDGHRPRGKTSLERWLARWLPGVSSTCRAPVTEHSPLVLTATPRSVPPPLAGPDTDGSLPPLGG